MSTPGVTPKPSGHKPASSTPDSPTPDGPCLTQPSDGMTPTGFEPALVPVRLPPRDSNFDECMKPVRIASICCCPLIMMMCVFLIISVPFAIMASVKSGNYRTADCNILECQDTSVGSVLLTLSIGEGKNFTKEFVLKENLSCLGAFSRGDNQLRLPQISSGHSSLQDSFPQIRTCYYDKKDLSQSIRFRKFPGQSKRLAISLLPIIPGVLLIILVEGMRPETSEASSRREGTNDRMKSDRMYCGCLYAVDEHVINPTIRPSRSLIVISNYPSSSLVYSSSISSSSISTSSISSSSITKAWH